MLELEKPCSSRPGGRLYQWPPTASALPRAVRMPMSLAVINRLSGRGLSRFRAEAVQYQRGLPTFPLGHSGQHCSSWRWLRHHGTWCEGSDNLQQSPHTGYFISSAAVAWFSLVWAVMLRDHGRQTAQGKPVTGLLRSMFNFPPSLNQVISVITVGRLPCATDWARQAPCWVLGNKFPEWKEFMV